MTRPYPLGVYDPAKVLAFGERLCLEQGEYPSARTLARRLGVSQRTIVRYRTGAHQSVRPQVIDAIERWHGVHASMFERDEAVV